MYYALTNFPLSGGSLLSGRDQAMSERETGAQAATVVPSKPPRGRTSACG